jgi:hypothetical protein
MTITHTVRLDSELDARLQAEARRRKATIADLWREMVKALPPPESQRLTNVDPLPDDVLERLYRERDDDPPGIKQMIAAQAKAAKARDE